MSKKATCFDKLLKWTLLGLQGRKLFSILSRPIRFKSIIIGNCSLEMGDQDKETFRRGFGLEVDPEIRTGLHTSQDQQGEPKSHQHDEQSDTCGRIECKAGEEAAETDESEGPRRKRLKASDQSDEADERCDEKDDAVEKKLVEKKGPDGEKRCENEKESAVTNRPSSSLFEPTKPEIHFSDTFVNELFIRKDGKRPQDKSVVYFLEPKERKVELKEEPKAELKAEAKEVASDNPPGSDGQSNANPSDTQRDSGAVTAQEVLGDASGKETSKVKGDRVSAERATKGESVGKPKRPKDEYRVECIQDGRKLGSTKQNYERLLLTLSPSSLDGLIASALEKAAIDLRKSESIKAYDSTWNRLRKQHPNFVRWL